MLVSGNGCELDLGCCKLMRDGWFVSGSWPLLDRSDVGREIGFLVKVCRLGLSAGWSKLSKWVEWWVKL